MDEGRSITFMKSAEKTDVAKPDSQTVEKVAAITTEQLKRLPEDLVSNPTSTAHDLAVAANLDKPGTTGIASGVGLGAVLAALGATARAHGSKSIITNPLLLGALGTAGGYIGGQVLDNLATAKEPPKPRTSERVADIITALTKGKSRRPSGFVGLGEGAIGALSAGYLKKLLTTSRLHANSEASAELARALEARSIRNVLAARRMGSRADDFTRYEDLTPDAEILNIHEDGSPVVDRSGRPQTTTEPGLKTDFRESFKMPSNGFGENPVTGVNFGAAGTGEEFTNALRTSLRDDLRELERIKDSTREVDAARIDALKTRITRTQNILEEVVGKEEKGNIVARVKDEVLKKLKEKKGKDGKIVAETKLKLPKSLGGWTNGERFANLRDFLFEQGGNRHYYLPDFSGHGLSGKLRGLANWTRRGEIPHTSLHIRPGRGLQSLGVLSSLLGVGLGIDGIRRIFRSSTSKELRRGTSRLWKNWHSDK